MATLLLGPPVNAGHCDYLENGSFRGSREVSHMMLHCMVQRCAQPTPSQAAGCSQSGRNC